MTSLANSCKNPNTVTMVLILLALLNSPVLGRYAVAEPMASGPLDGLVFVGRIGLEGALDLDEELHFNHGQMWSKNCVACGFLPAPYWVRMVGNDIHFQGQLTSDGGSTFTYRGRISGTLAEVDVRWTKSRWYWSIDRMMVFRGHRDMDRVAMNAIAAFQEASAAGADRLPGWCP